MGPSAAARSKMSNAIYIGILASCIVGTAAYTYADSERRTVVVKGKYVENVRGRWGRTSERLVLRTSAGDLPILEFPLIGYLWGAEDIYATIETGETIDVRLGPWPPRLMTGAPGPMRIMEVY